MDITLLLMTGQNIPIPECQLIVHQPTISEIALIGEKTFFTGAQCICINKSMYIDTQSQELENITNFDIFISLLNEKKAAEQKECVLALFKILFPEYKAFITPRAIMLKLDSENFILDESNFESFQDVCRKIFCLSQSAQDTFNPANAAAKAIADKLMRGRQRVAAQKAAEGGGGSIFTRYLSILTVGLKSMSLQNLIDLTIFQIYDLVERLMLHTNWDMDIKARLAGAKADKELENWMKSIH